MAGWRRLMVLAVAMVALGRLGAPAHAAPSVPSEAQCSDEAAKNERLYGIPTAIGGVAHTCGRTGFAPGGRYPTVALDKIHERLAGLSHEILVAVQSRYRELDQVYVPVSMALFTRYDNAYLGIGPVKKES